MLVYTTYWPKQSWQHKVVGGTKRVRPDAPRSSVFSRCSRKISEQRLGKMLTKLARHTPPPTHVHTPRTRNMARLTALHPSYPSLRRQFALSAPVRLLSSHSPSPPPHHQRQRPSFITSLRVGLVKHVAHSTVQASEMGLSVVPALKARVMAVEFVKNNPRIKAMLDHPAGP